MRCYQNKTSFAWSYRDSSKRSLENNVISRRGEKNTHTWDRWTCANGKQWSRGTKEVLVIRLHMVGKMSLDLLILKPWNSECTLENYGAYFIFTHTHIFSGTYIFFFLIKFFYLLPLNSKIAFYLPPRPCLDVCSSSGKEVIEIR
jgi:hypothetical protein